MIVKIDINFILTLFLFCSVFFYCKFNIANGNVIAPYIVGGRNATDGDAPWQVSIRDPMQQVLCGGSIISSRWILTAESCINELTSK